MMVMVMFMVMEVVLTMVHYHDDGYGDMYPSTNVFLKSSNVFPMSTNVFLKSSNVFMLSSDVIRYYD